ncbi:MAG TPA: aminotransferase class IV [Acidimicrobiales bacterium]|nr:aminotransferase class IV [Acidimicrobiales bacterium]
MDQLPAVLVSLGPAGPTLMDARAPFLRADDVGALRGDGVFERFLVRAGEPRHFEDHLARLARSARQVGLAVPKEASWREAVGTAIAAWQGNDEWEMRLVCTAGPEEGGQPTAYVLGQQLTEALLRQRVEGVAVVTLSRGMVSGLGAQCPWLLLGAKTLSYSVNLAARRWAKEQGADDAIFVGTDGLVWEATTSAVVAAYGRRLVSPPSAVGILDSVTVSALLRDAVRAGWGAARENLTVADLLSADGVWLSSSLRFAAVNALDGKTLPAHPAQEELAALATR